MNPNNKETEKCCEDYNGDLDVTNSCIFCKKYFLPQGDTVEDWESNFLERFGNMLDYIEVHTGMSERENIKSFIRQLLSQAEAKGREAEREEIVEMLTKHPQKIIGSFS